MDVSRELGASHRAGQKGDKWGMLLVSRGNGAVPSSLKNEELRGGLKCRGRRGLLQVALQGCRA